MNPGDPWWSERVPSEAGCGATAKLPREIARAYRRVLRLSRLARWDPEEPAFAAAFWKAADELKEQLRPPRPRRGAGRPGRGFRRGAGAHRRWVG